MGSEQLILVLTGTLLLTVHQLLGIVQVEAQNTSFSFEAFTSQDGQNTTFSTSGDVQYYPTDESFLMNPMSAALSFKSCGRLMYYEKVRMKNTATGEVASFNTSFSFQIRGGEFYYSYDQNYGVFQHGDGFAFTFARDLTGEDPESTLCLLKGTENGLASNRLFAVEFDTYQNEAWNDSSDSHIGVNVNSMNSTWYYNLCGDGHGNASLHCSYLCNKGTFTAWIDYDSASQNLQVFFANGTKISKPQEPVIEAAGLSLSVLLDEYMYVGFSSSTGGQTEVNEIQSWSFTSSGMPPRQAASNVSSQHRNVGIIAGVVGGAAAVLLAIFFVGWYRRKKSHMKQDKFNLMDQNLVPRMFTYEELSKATKNFNQSELLGSGGFGAVYKGTLPSGALVAVKRMRHGSRHGEESFRAEAASLSQIRHRNLVQLRGWCHEEEQLFLVYDYMSNGSLDEWLFKSSRRAWKQPAEALLLGLRHSVLSGVAAALAYLHEECVQCVLHRDIKSSNVLLDADWNAFVGDFGLARLIDHRKTEKTTLMAGTLGYMAPEMPHTGKATKESDVYSFGVLVLEVMCGTRPLDATAVERGEGVLVDRVWRAHEAGAILDVADSRLGTFPPTDAVQRGSDAAGFEMLESERDLITTDDFDYLSSGKIATADKNLIVSLLHLGLLCCHPAPDERPGMRVVSQWLQAAEKMEAAMPPLPARKPQGHYSEPGLSQLTLIPSSTPSSSQYSGSVSASEGKPAVVKFTSFAKTSSVLSGR